MIPSARHALSATIAIAVVALAGCGGSSSSTDTAANFKDTFEPAAGQLQTGGAAIAGAVTNASSLTDAQVQATFHQLASRWRTALNKVTSLDAPPAQATGLNDLTDAGDRVESDLNGVAAAAATHNVEAAKQESSGLLTDLVAVKSAAVAVERTSSTPTSP